ncbi:hypothetical protein EG328_008778 [Venturia inaequalis]|nr:hypothetical protein EG328_008778 [Venturia inaequalis]KAE9968279.1 hypothetical protein EG327_011117 [Venturia inaequalis]RDI88820.1 hypothetical protein Vi05172_g1465 [Venturia inaequalis]
MASHYYLTGDAVIIADWVLLAVAYTLVSVRLWFRLLHQRRSLTLSDTCLCVAAAVVLMVMIIFQKEHALGAMRMHKSYVPTPQVKKLSFVTILGYHTATYFTKFSILAFYSNLFPTGSPKLRKVLFVVTVYTICCYIAAMLLAVFWCGSRPSRNWEPGNIGCSLWDYTLFKTDFALNISSDILIFALPFPVLTTLTLSTRQLVALCVTFGLGLITITVSIGRCVALLHNAFISLYVWSMAEMCTAIMVVSLPSLRPLLRKTRPSKSSPNTGDPHKTGENPLSQGMNKKRHSITSSRDAYTINNSGSHGASDLELVDVSPRSKDGWQMEHVEAHQHRGLEKSTPERSKEWV